MPRIRSIHPEACDSDKLARLSHAAERTLWRLTTHVDDDGRVADNPKLLAAKLFPLVDEVDGDALDGLLDELVDVGMVLRYEVEGRRYLEVHDFTDWQRPKRKVDSKLPPPPPRPVPDSPPPGEHGGNTSPPRGEHSDPGVGDGVGGEGETDTGDGVATAPHDWPRIANDGTYTDRIVTWARAHGHTRRLETEADRTRWCLDLAADQLGSTPRGVGAAVELVVEWVERTCGEPLATPARKHLVRLLNAEGPRLTFTAMEAAVTGGAGLSEQYADDPQALVRYARSCIARWRAEGQGRAS